MSHDEWLPKRFTFVRLHVSKVIGTNLLWGAVFSRGLSGLVAMSASSASQLVFGEQLNSWWETPAATWNTPGDLWSSSTSCKSGMSSKGGTMRGDYHQAGFWGKKTKNVTVLLFWGFYRNPFDTRARRAGPRCTWGGQRTRPFSQLSAFPCPQNRLFTSLINFLHHILVSGCKRRQNSGN